MAEINGIKWHVVQGGQRLVSDISPSGNGFASMWEVTYLIDSGPAMGTEGTVRIPAAQFNAETVKATINALVTHQHAVAGL